LRIPKVVYDCTVAAVKALQKLAVGTRMKTIELQVDKLADDYSLTGFTKEALSKICLGTYIFKDAKEVATTNDAKEIGAVQDAKEGVATEYEFVRTDVIKVALEELQQILRLVFKCGEWETVEALFTSLDHLCEVRNMSHVTPALTLAPLAVCWGAGGMLFFRHSE
jgi:hypothetical protein